MLSNPTTWEYHWKSLSSIARKQSDSLPFLQDARRIAIQDHRTRLHLAAVQKDWHKLPLDITPKGGRSVGPVLATLLPCLTSAEPDALTRATSLVEQWLLQLPGLEPNEQTSEWRCLSYAIHLGVTLKPDTTDWTPLVNLLRDHPDRHDWWRQLPWRAEDVATTLEPLDLPSPYWLDVDHPKDSEAYALRSLLLHHDPEPLLSHEPTVLTRNLILAHGLAAAQGLSEAEQRLHQWENLDPVTVLGAYSLSGTSTAVEKLLQALKSGASPLKTVAQGCCQAMTGLPLVQKQLDPDTVRQWWQQQDPAQGPWLNGKPATPENTLAFLRQFGGEPTRPAWWLWQWQNQVAAPNLISGWHNERLRWLDFMSMTQKEVDRAAG